MPLPPLLPPSSAGCSRNVGLGSLTAATAAFSDWHVAQLQLVSGLRWQAADGCGLPIVIQRRPGGRPPSTQFQVRLGGILMGIEEPHVRPRALIFYAPFCAWGVLIPSDKTDKTDDVLFRPRALSSVVAFRLLIAVARRLPGARLPLVAEMGGEKRKSGEKKTGYISCHDVCRNRQPQRGSRAEPDPNRCKQPPSQSCNEMCNNHLPALR